MNASVKVGKRKQEGCRLRKQRETIKMQDIWDCVSSSSGTIITNTGLKKAPSTRILRNSSSRQVFRNVSPFRFSLFKLDLLGKIFSRRLISQPRGHFSERGNGPVVSPSSTRLLF